MVAWTGIEHFRMGRFDPPPPAVESEDFVVGFKLLNTNNCSICLILPIIYHCLHSPLHAPPSPPPPFSLKKGNLEEGIVVAWWEKRGQSLLLVLEINFFGYEKFIILVIIISTSKLLHPAAQLSPFMTP